MSPTHAFLIYGSEPKRTCVLFSGSLFAKEPQTPKPRPFLATEVGDRAPGVENSWRPTRFHLLLDSSVGHPAFWSSSSSRSALLAELIWSAHIQDGICWEGHQKPVPCLLPGACLHGHPSSHLSSIINWPVPRSFAKEQQL